MSVPGRVETAREQVTSGRSVSKHGLCIACRKDPTCSYLRNASLPVLQCEEFEGYEPRARILGNHNGSIAQGPLRDPVPAEDKGLCVTCENRDTCAFPKPAGGIWHCEEFR